MAAGLAMTAAALIAAGTGSPGRPRPQDQAAAPRPAHPVPGPVTAPVRIADAEAVRLLRSGDLVDVVAANGSAAGGTRSRVVAAGARVVEVPESEDGPAVDGALVVLSVPRATAAELAGAGATSRLAVVLC